MIHPVIYARRLRYLYTSVLNNCRQWRSSWRPVLLPELLILKTTLYRYCLFLGYGLRYLMRRFPIAFSILHRRPVCCSPVFRGHILLLLLEKTSNRFRSPRRPFVRASIAKRYIPSSNRSH